MVSTQAVDNKTLGVNLLFGINGFARGIQLPIKTTLLGIVKICQQIIEGAGRAGCVMRIARGARRFAKKPQQPRVEDYAFAGILYWLIVRIHLAVKATLFEVLSVGNPPIGYGN